MTTIFNDALTETNKAISADITSATVLAQQVLADESQLIRRFYRDGSPSVVISDPALQSYDVGHASVSEKWVALTYLDSDTAASKAELLLEDGSRVEVIAGTEPIFVRPHGRHGSASGSGVGLLLFGYDDQTLSKLQLAAPGSMLTCFNDSSINLPDNKLVARVDRQTLIWIDLSGDQPIVAETISPGLGEIGCPFFAADGNSFAYLTSERSIYHVDWPASGPSEPRLVYSEVESPHFSLLAVH
jgi:hypothetical protein